MSWKVNSTYWGQSCLPACVHETQKSLVGYPVASEVKFAEAQDLETIEALTPHLSAGWADKDVSVDAQTLFQFIRTPHQKPNVTLPKRCHKRPPKDHNAFSDGSFTNPLHRPWSLGGAGVWWPGRDTRIKPLSKAELEMAYHLQCNDGLRVMLPVPGTAGNSTRMELAAAILAMLSDDPVNFGTDSQAFIDKANACIQRIRDGLPPREPWGVQKDGDLWHIFHDVICAKGCDSVIFSKVKGHATDEQVALGVVKLCHKIGNDQADTTADLAVKLHGPEVVKLARRMCNRVVKFVDLVILILKHNLEGYLIHQRLTEVKLAAINMANGANLRTIGFLEHGVSDTAGRLTFMHEPARFPSSFRGYRRVNHVYNYLRAISVSPLIEGSQGISWIEIYILYRMAGFPPPLDQPLNPAAPRRTLKQQLNAFKLCARRIIMRLASRETSAVFQTPVCKTPRFLALQVLGHTPTVACRFHISDEAAASLRKYLVILLHRPSAANLQLALDQAISVHKRKVVIHKGVRFDNCISHVTYDIFPRAAGPQPSQPSPAHESVVERIPATEPFFKCPKCEHHVHAAHPSFHACNLETPVKCKGCARKVPVFRFNCSCAIQWHLCNTHRTIPSSLLESCIGLKRKLVHDEECENRKSHRATAECSARSLPEHVRLNPNLLSPSLKRRFAHLLQPEKRSKTGEGT